MKLILLIQFVVFSIYYSFGQIGFGCTDPEACNYDSDALFDDAGISCEYPINTYYIPIIPENSGMPVILVECQEVPVGYVEANQLIIQMLIDADDYCLNVSFDDLCNNQYMNLLDINGGCMWETACNYDETALFDDGTCQYEFHWIDFDGSGAIIISSCQADFNINELGGLVDEVLNESCFQEIPNYLSYSDWFEIPLEDINAYEACRELKEMYYCNDPNACNYHWDAQDGNPCIYEYTTFISINPQIITEGCGGHSDVVNVKPCCVEEAVNYLGYDSVFEFHVSLGEAGGYDISDFWDAYRICAVSTPAGCTNLKACNYNPEACEDDGSCTFPGCSDFSAINYNPNLSCSDQDTCVFSDDVFCPGDMNGDLVVSAADLTTFLSVFGSECEIE